MKIEGIVTCDDHDECEANALIKEDAEEMGKFSEYPSFLEWYDGPVTPVRSGKINLEPFDRFVKWSYVEEIDSLETGLVDESETRLFYAPVMKPDWGIVHKLHSTKPCSRENEINILEECLIGFIPTYRGVETEFRPGFITIVETGRDFFGEADIYWTYAD
jgi:hypothetical protein